MRRIFIVYVGFCVLSFVGCRSAIEPNHRQAVVLSVAALSPTSIRQSIPASVSAGQDANPVPRDSGKRNLAWSGYEWRVKTSGERVGPGPNYFSDKEENVLVDAEGRLHMRITKREDHWICPEVVSKKSFGYGTYRFYVASNVDKLDPQAILGLFTWNDAPAYNHREIDVEISRWGQAKNDNAQFVIQPYSRLANIVRFSLPTGLDATIQSFVWKPDSVVFQSLKGADPTPEESRIIHEKSFKSGIPKAGGENARINLWLLSGHPPKNGEEAEIILSKFEFIPGS